MISLLMIILIDVMSKFLLVIVSNHQGKASLSNDLFWDNLMTLLTSWTDVFEVVDVDDEPTWLLFKCIDQYNLSGNN